MRENSNISDSENAHVPVVRRQWVRPAGWLLTVALLGAPLSVMAPTPASAHEAAVEGARVATEDMAVTERPLEEVSAPDGYSEGGEKDAIEVRADEAQLYTAQDAAQVEDSEREELSLARALVSSPTAVLGVTFPLDNVDDTVAISYRIRQGAQWSEWKPMDLADPSAAPEYARSTTVGTEPVPLTETDEVEVAVRAADGRSLPGAQLTLIEPELSIDDLDHAQVVTHGQQAIDAVESMVDDVISEKEIGQNSGSEPQDRDGAQESTGASPTPAELAEEFASITVPVGGSLGGHEVGGPLGTVRMVGPTPDGNSYITDIPGLTITTRKGWGADERVMDWEADKVTFRGAVVHHTAGSNTYTKAQVPHIVQGVYRYHAVTLGWGDVGYHLLVDKYGGVWEGRAGGLTNSVQGGHAYGANTTTFGISVLGDYMQVRPSDEAIDALAKAIAWKLKVHNITNLDATFTTRGNQWGKSSVQLPVVSAHRHVGGTSCPGDAFMTRWDELQRSVRHYMTARPQSEPSKPKVESQPKPKPESKPKAGSQPVARWSSRQQIGQGWPTTMYYAAEFLGTEHTDAMLIDAKGDLWLYPSVDYGQRFSQRKRIGYGWGSMDIVLTNSDFDGDDIADIVARQNNGDLYLYPGNGKGSFRSKKKIGWGWSGFSKLYMMQRFDDGRPVIYAVTPQGQLRAYPTNGRGQFLDPITMGYGWENMRALSNVGNKVGSAESDVIAIDKNGAMWLYEGKGSGALGARHQIGQGWGGFTPVQAMDESGRIWAVDGSGRLWLYTFKGL